MSAPQLTVITGPKPKPKVTWLKGRRILQTREQEERTMKTDGKDMKLNLGEGKLYCAAMPTNSDIVQNGKNIQLGLYSTQSQVARAAVITLAMLVRMTQYTTRAVQHPAEKKEQPQGRGGGRGGRGNDEEDRDAFEDNFDEFDDELEQQRAAGVLQLPKVFGELVPSRTTPTTACFFKPLLKQPPMRVWSREDVKDALQNRKRRDQESEDSDAEDERMLQEKQALIDRVMAGGPAEEKEEALVLGQSTSTRIDSDDDETGPVVQPPGTSSSLLNQDDDDDDDEWGAPPLPVQTETKEEEPRPELPPVSLSSSSSSSSSSSEIPNEMDQDDEEEEDEGEDEEDEGEEILNPGTSLTRLLKLNKRGIDLATKSQDVGCFRLWVWVPNALIQLFETSLKMILSENRKYLQMEAQRAARRKVNPMEGFSKDADRARSVGQDPSLYMEHEVDIASMYAVHAHRRGVGVHLLNSQFESILEQGHPLHPSKVYSPDRAIRDPQQAYSPLFSRGRSYTQTGKMRAPGIFTFPDEVNTFQLAPEHLTVKNLLQAGLPAVIPQIVGSHGFLTRRDVEAALDTSMLSNKPTTNRTADREYDRFMETTLNMGPDTDDEEAETPPTEAQIREEIEDTMNFAAGCEPGEALAADTDTMRAVLHKERENIERLAGSIASCPELEDATAFNLARRRQLLFQMNLAVWVRGSAMWNRVARLETDFFPRSTEGVVRYLLTFADRNNNSLFREQSYTFTNLSLMGSYMARQMSIIDEVYKANSCHELMQILWASNHNCSDPDKKSKLHSINFGPPAVGKSFGAENTLKWLAHDHCSQNDTYTSAKATYTGANQQRFVTYKDEINPSKFGIGPTGSYQTTTESAEYKQQTSDPVIRFTATVMGENGERSLHEIRRANNTCHQGNTNDPIIWFPAPVRSRFIWTLGLTAERDDKSMPEQICAEKDKDAQRVMKNHIECMNWESAMVHMMHAKIEAGVLDETQTPYASFMTPRFIRCLRINGIPEPNGEARYIKRLLGMVRVLVDVRAVNLVFGSTSSPLCPARARQKTGKNKTVSLGSKLVNDPLDATQFQLLRLHQTDTYDPSLFVMAVGLLRYQWRQNFYEEVITALQNMFWHVDGDLFQKFKDQEAADNNDEVSVIDLDDEGEGAAASSFSFNATLPEPLVGTFGLPFPTRTEPGEADGTPSKSARDRYNDDFLAHFQTYGPFVNHRHDAMPPLDILRTWYSESERNEDETTQEIETEEEILLESKTANQANSSPPPPPTPSSSDREAYLDEKYDPEIADQSHYEWTGPKTEKWQKAFIRRERKWRMQEEAEDAQRREDEYAYYTKVRLPAERKALIAKGRTSTEARRATRYLTVDDCPSLTAVSQRIANELNIDIFVVRDILKAVETLHYDVPVIRSAPNNDESQAPATKRTQKCLALRYNKTTQTLSVLPQLFRDNKKDAVLRSLRTAIETDIMVPFVCPFGIRPGQFGHARLVGFIPNPDCPTCLPRRAAPPAFLQTALNHTTTHADSVGFALQRSIDQADSEMRKSTSRAWTNNPFYDFACDAMDSDEEENERTELVAASKLHVYSKTDTDNRNDIRLDKPIIEHLHETFLQRVSVPHAANDLFMGFRESTLCARERAHQREELKEWKDAAKEAVLQLMQKQGYSSRQALAEVCLQGTGLTGRQKRPMPTIASVFPVHIPKGDKDARARENAERRWKVQQDLLKEWGIADRPARARGKIRYKKRGKRKRNDSSTIQSGPKRRKSAWTRNS